MFYFLYGLYAFYEIITGNHLPTSDLFDAPYWLRYSPTVVYYNSNDFASIFTLMFMYLLSIYDKEKTLSILWLFYNNMFPPIDSLLFTESNFTISFFTFLGFRYPFKLAYSSIIGVLIFLVGITMFEPNWYMQFLDGLKELKTDLLFSDRQSTSIRLYLYKHSIMSIFSSYGIGYGIDYSLQYFQSINDPNLSHIVNPHSYIFEILINSGVLALLGFIIIEYLSYCTKYFFKRIRFGCSSFYVESITIFIKFNIIHLDNLSFYIYIHLQNSTASNKI